MPSYRDSDPGCFLACVTFEGGETGQAPLSRLTSSHTHTGHTLRAPFPADQPRSQIQEPRTISARSVNAWLPAGSKASDRLRRSADGVNSPKNGTQASSLPFRRRGRWGLSPLRAAFLPAHPLARRDVPVARTRAFRFSVSLFRGVAKVALYCAHRATTVSSWGLCEQEGHLAAPYHSSATARCASTGNEQATLLSPFCSFLLCQVLQHSLTPQDGILLVP
jgi:hypothetical protein